MPENLDATCHGRKTVGTVTSINSATETTSIEYEQSLLGGILLNNAAWPDVSRLIEERDFSQHSHRLIFRAITDLFERKHAADIVTLADALEQAGVLQEVGDWVYLGLLVRDTPSAVNVREYARIVRRKSLERRRLAAIANNDHHQAAAITAAIDTLEAGAARQKLKRTIFTLDDLTIPPPPPAFLIAGYLPKDAYVRNATGGTGKSTMELIHAIHLILGEPLWDMEILEPGPVLYVTAEDGEDRLKWRLFNIVDQMGLNRSDRQRITENLYVINLVGSGRKLVNLDRDGNLVITSLADEIIEQFTEIKPIKVHFDPMIKFSPGERFLNDAEDMLINAAMRIKEGLKCAAGYDHHVSKEVMRNGIVDHHAGRGGAALGDGARAVYSLLTITKELAPNYPGISLFQDDIAAGRLLAYQITKLTDAPKPLEPLILRRNGWLFEPVKLPEPAEIERAIIDARCERARQNLDKLVAYLKEHQYTKPSRKNLEDVHRDVGMSRDDLRAAITQGLMTTTLIERSLPADEQKGARKTYLAVGGAD